MRFTGHFIILRIKEFKNEIVWHCQSELFVEGEINGIGVARSQECSRSLSAVRFRKQAELMSRLVYQIPGRAQVTRGRPTTHLWKPCVKRTNSVLRQRRSHETISSHRSRGSKSGRNEERNSNECDADVWINCEFKSCSSKRNVTCSALNGSGRIPRRLRRSQYTPPY